MKTLVLSMISIAATVAAMTACTSESDEIDNVVEAPQEIKMSAAVLDIVTKSDGPVEGLNSKITGVNFLSQESASGQDATIVWTGDKIGSHTASIETSGAITFDDATKPYYSSDPDKYTYLVGYHPSGTFSSGNVTFNITGKEDIMYAGVVNGNKETNKKTEAADKVLKPEFKHLLAQLKIQIKGEKAAADAWGKIKTIKVQNARTELILNVKDGKLSEGTTALQDINLIRSDANEIAIPTTELPIGYSMVFPQKTQYKLIIDTENVTGKIVEFTIPKDDIAPAREENETRAGEAYTITLTFSASEISAEAKVDGWKEVTGGTGTVD